MKYQKWWSFEDYPSQKIARQSSLSNISRNKYRTEQVSELTREFFSAIIQLLLTYDKHLINKNRSLDKVENLNYTRLSLI